MKISIVIPCFNEKNTILDIIEKVKKESIYEKEIIVIDDYSTDGTREILEKTSSQDNFKLILNKQNFGKGYSVRQGIAAASGDIILIQDADLEYDPSDYPKLIEPIKKGYADVVYGSRFVGSDEKRVLFYWHRVGNFILTTLSNMLSNLNLTDMENCYKVFRSEMISDYKKKWKNLEYGKIIKVSSNFIIVKCGSGLIKLKSIVPKLSAKKGEYL